MNCLYVCSGCSFVFKTQQTLLIHAASCPLVSRRAANAGDHGATTSTEAESMRPGGAIQSGIPIGASVPSSSAVCRLLGTGDSAPISGAGALNTTGSADPGESAQQYVYVCSMCRTMFHSVVLLKTHYENHWRGNVTDCLFCGWLGPDYHSFIQHIIRQHTERWRSEWTAPLGCASTRLFTCRLCDGQFACPQLLRTHYSSHWQPVGLHSGRMLMCFCLRKLASYNRLLNHLCSYHTDAYELTEAGYQLISSRPSELSASAGFKEPIAKRMAAAVIETGRHFPPRRYECPVCLRKFPTVNNLVVHRRSTSCGRRTSSAGITVVSSTVDSGSGAVSEPVQEQFLCGMCGEVFRFSSHLMRHKRERCMLRPNTGPEQPAARPAPESTEQASAAGASRAAAGDVPEVSVDAVNQSGCVEQDAAAATARTAGDRRRPGGTGKAVRDKNGKLLSRCGRCGLLFSCAGAMKNHLDNNCIGEKLPTQIPRRQFECPSCQRKFDTNSMLKWHMVRECQLPSKFRCSVCLKYFMRGDHMRRHLRKVHKLQGEQLERAAAIGAASRSSAGSAAIKDRRFRFKAAASAAASVASAHADAGATCDLVDLTLDEDDAPSVAVTPPFPQNLVAVPVSTGIPLNSPMLLMNAATDRLNLVARPLNAVVDSSVACQACQLMFLSPESLRSHIAATGCGRWTRPADDAAVEDESVYPSLGDSPSPEDAPQSDPFRGIGPESPPPHGDMLTGSCREDGVDSYASPMTTGNGSVSVRRLCGGIVSIVKNGLAGSHRIPSPPSYEAAIKQTAHQRPRPFLTEPGAFSGRESAASLVTVTSSPVLEAALVAGADSAGPSRASVEREADAVADCEETAVTPSTPRLKVSRIASLRVFGRAADLSPALVIKEERLAFGEPLEEESTVVGGEQVDEQRATTAPSDSALTVKLESFTQSHAAGSLAVDSTALRSSVLESLLTTDDSEPFHVELESVEVHAPQIKPEPAAQLYCDVPSPPPPPTPPLALPPAADPLIPAAAGPNSCLSAWFNCNMCRQAFTSPNNLADHVLRSHPDRADQSPQVDVTSRKKVSREMYRCRLCFKVLLFLSDFKRHCESHWRRAPYTCCICPAVMPDCSALSVHLITQHRDKVVRLNPDSVSSPDGQGSAVAWPSSGAALVGKPRSLALRRCPICAHRFSNRNQLEKHCRGHWKDPPFYCDFCSKRFVSGNHLVKHVLSEHADGDSCSVSAAAAEPGVPSSPLKVPSAAAVQKPTSSASAVAKRRTHMSRARCPHCHDPFREWRNVRRHVKNGSCRNMSLIGLPPAAGDAANLIAGLGAGGSPAVNARADVGVYAASIESDEKSAPAGVKSGARSEKPTVKLVDRSVLPVIADVKKSDVPNVETVESDVETALQDVETAESDVETAVPDVYKGASPFAEPSSAYIPPAEAGNGLYCDMCGLHCRLRVELVGHLLVCSSRPPGHRLPYDCISCGVGLPNKHRLFDHALCARCPGAASRRTALAPPRRDTRARCHSPPPNGQLRKRCPRCHSFFFKRGLFAHVKHCRGTLSTRSKQHRPTEMSGRVLSADKGKSFRCRDCGRHFLSNNGRWRHRRGRCPMMASSAAVYSDPVQPVAGVSGALKPSGDAGGVLKPSRVHKKKRRTATSERRFLFRHVCALCGQKQENQLEMAHHLLMTHGHSGLASDLRANMRLLGSCPWCHQLRSLGSMERHCISHWSNVPDGLVCQFCSQPQLSAPQYFQHLTHRHFELFRARPSEPASQPVAAPLPTDFDLLPKFGCLCAICGTKFQEQDELRAHLHLTHRFSGKHEPRSLIRMCPFCDLVRPIRYLKMHFADHWNAGHPRCTLCSRQPRSHLELFWHTYHCHFDAFRPAGAASSSGQRCKPVAVQALPGVATSTGIAANVGVSTSAARVLPAIASAHIHRDGSKPTVVASAVTAADIPKPANELSTGSPVSSTPASTGSTVDKCKPKSLVGAENVAASIRVVKRTGKIACLWRCNVCKKRLDSRRRMEMHTCHRKRLFEFICRCCGVQPGGRAALIEHIAAQHPGISKDESSGGVKHTCNLSYRCPLCKDIVQLKSIKEHIFRAHWNHEPTVCAFCPRKLNTFISYYVHVSSAHFDRFVFAPKGVILCSPAAARPSSASIAAQLPSAVVNYEREPAAGAADPAPEDEGFEEDCSSRWTPESYGSSPVDSVAGTAAAGSPRCHHCSLVFPSTELLGLHGCRKLRGSFNNICATCGTGCGTAEALVQHMQRVHQVSVAPCGGPSSRRLWYRCPFCTCVKKLSDMKSHWRSHWLHGPFSCTLCPRTLSLRAELFNHIAKQHFDALEYQPGGVGTAGAAAGDVSDARSPASSDIKHRVTVDAPSTSKRTEPVELPPPSPPPPPSPRRSSAAGDLRTMSAIALALLSPVVRLTRLDRLAEWGSPNPGGDAHTRRFACRKCDRLFGSHSGRNKHEKLRCPLRTGQRSGTAPQLDESVVPRCGDCGCVFRLRVALLQHRNRGCRLYCGSCGERFSDQLAKEEHSCSAPAGHQLQAANPGQLERKLMPVGPQQDASSSPFLDPFVLQQEEASLPLAAGRTSPDPWQEERCGRLKKKVSFPGPVPDRSHSVVDVQDTRAHRGLNATPVLAASNVTMSHQSFSSTAGVLRDVSGSAVAQREKDSTVAEEDSVMVEDDSSVFEDDSMVFEDGSVVVEDDSVVVEDVSVVVEGSSVVGDDSVVVEDESVVIEDDSVVVEDDSMVVEDDSMVVEDDSAVLDEGSGSVSAVATGCVSAQRRGELTRCEVCDKSMRRSSIVRHCQRVHGVGGAPRYSCPVCPWRSFDRPRVISHVQRHVLSSAEQLRRPDGRQLVPLVTPISLQILHAQTRVHSWDVAQERTASCGRIVGHAGSAGDIVGHTDSAGDIDGHTDSVENTHGHTDSTEDTYGHADSGEGTHGHTDSAEDTHGHTDSGEDTHRHTGSVEDTHGHTDGVEDTLKYLDSSDLRD